MERWTTIGASCAGCVSLARVGVFWSGEAPRPPLHAGCDCVIRSVSTVGMLRGSLLALGYEADRNGRRASRVFDRALARLGE